MTSTLADALSDVADALRRLADVLRTDADPRTTDVLDVAIRGALAPAEGPTTTLRFRETERLFSEVETLTPSAPEPVEEPEPKRSRTAPVLVKRHREPVLKRRIVAAYVANCSLVEARQRCGAYQHEVAPVLGVSRSALSRAERYERDEVGWGEVTECRAAYDEVQAARELKRRKGVAA